MTQSDGNHAMVAMKLLTILLISISAIAAEPIKLWSSIAPGEKEAREDQLLLNDDGLQRISDVTVPTLEVFHAKKDKASGVAVLVCPGGGYNILAIAHEGTELCHWLSDHGITAVLLKYRVPRRQKREKHEAPLQDAQRAMTMIRANAKTWGIDPQKIGVMGFSAGGHLAATLMGQIKRDYLDEKKYENLSSQPDFAILIYPAYLQKGTSTSELAPELNFGINSKPVFIAVARNDRFFPSSDLLNTKLIELGASVEMHVFPTGGHGFGMGTRRGGDEAKVWPSRCLKWMHSIGVMTK